MTECYEQHAVDKKKIEELKYIQLEGVPPPKKNKALTKAGESLLKGFKVRCPVAPIIKGTFIG